MLCHSTSMQPSVCMQITNFFFNQFRILGFMTVFHELILILNGEVYEFSDTST